MGPTELQGYYMPYPTPESRLPQSIFPREILASSEYLLEVEAGLERLVSKPVLLIWGMRDPGFGDRERDRFLDHFNHASVVLLPNANTSYTLMSRTVPLMLYWPSRENRGSLAHDESLVPTTPGVAEST